MINTRHWVNRKYFLQASSISVHAEQGGDSKTAMTGLLLVIWLVNSARKNTLYFKSQHTKPAHSAQKRSTGVSGQAQRDYWRRRSCMKNPGTRSRSRKCSCLVCIQLPASCCALRSSYLQKHGLPPSCLTTFVGEGHKCVQNPWRSFHGRHCISTKFWTLWREELAETIPFKTLNQSRTPQLILIPDESSLWQAMRPYFGDKEPPSLPCPPTPPNLYRWMRWKHHLGGTQTTEVLLAAHV